MKKLNSGFDVVSIKGHDISFYDVSSCISDPQGAYIVIHGALGNSETTVDFAKSLAEKEHNRAVLLVDLPGHGNSPGAALTTIKEIAEVISDFVRMIQDSDRYGNELHLVGHSMGGSIVLQMLADGLDANRATVLMSSPEWGSMAPLLGVDENQLPAIFEQMMTQEFEHLGTNREDYLCRIPAMSVSPSAAMADLKALASFNIMSDLNRITTPLLIVAAEHDQTATAESIEAMASQLHSYDSHVVIGGTHTSVIGRAAELAEVVASY